MVNIKNLLKLTYHFGFLALGW